MFANVAILASFIFIAGYLNRDRALSPSSPLRVKVVLGVYSGILEIIL